MRDICHVPTSVGIRETYGLPVGVFYGSGRVRREIRVQVQGGAPMSRRPQGSKLLPMSRYLLEHRHEPKECGVVFASFKGHASPLRHRATLASCRSGGHAIWWTVEAETAEDALRLLPPYVAKRTTAAHVNEIDIP